MAGFAQLAQQDNGGAVLFGGFFLVLWLAVLVVYIVAGWRLFEKAGKPGWAAIIPIYNIYVFLQIVGREWWWLLLLLIPFVNFVVSIIVSIDLAKSFGKDTAWGIGIAFLGFIFVPMLAFGDAQYHGPAAAQGQGVI